MTTHREGHAAYLHRLAVARRIGRHLVADGAGVVACPICGGLAARKGQCWACRGVGVAARQEEK